MAHPGTCLTPTLGKKTACESLQNSSARAAAAAMAHPCSGE